MNEHEGKREANKMKETNETTTRLPAIEDQECTKDHGSVGCFKNSLTTTLSHIVQ